MKCLISLTAFFLIAFGGNSAEAKEISCKYGQVKFDYFGKLSTCTLNNDPNIDIFDKIDIPDKPKQDVQVFYAKNKLIQYIPSNLFQYFPSSTGILLTSITGIRLDNTQLKELKRDDFSAFTDITIFVSINNDVHYLEQGVFGNAEKLEYVNFRNNKLTYIDPNSFDAMLSLNHLDLSKQESDCDLGKADTRDEVVELIDKLKNSNCADPSNKPSSNEEL